jgi:biopolymer transport protein ExbD
MITKREARGIIRKAIKRVPEGEEIRHLNIMPMMDMMTILLVFMIKSMAVQTSALNFGDVKLPTSSTRQPPPEEAVQVVIARNVVLVEGEPVANVINGDVDPSAKSQGSFGIEITKLKTQLQGHRKRLEKIAAAQNRAPSKEVTIIADKDTPYRLLSSVMYTAGQAEFKQYRLIVLRNEE